MAEKEKLMDDYHRMLHELAVARNPIEAETARNIADNVITMLSVKLSECRRDYEKIEIWKQEMPVERYHVRLQT